MVSQPKVNGKGYSAGSVQGAIPITFKKKGGKTKRKKILILILYFNVAVYSFVNVDEYKVDPEN